MSTGSPVKTILVFLAHYGLFGVVPAFGAHLINQLLFAKIDWFIHPAIAALVGIVLLDVFIWWGQYDLTRRCGPDPRLV